MSVAIGCFLQTDKNTKPKFFVVKREKKKIGDISKILAQTLWIRFIERVKKWHQGQSIKQKKWDSVFIAVLIARTC